MNFINFPYNLMNLYQPDSWKNCSKQSLLSFLMTHYKLSKKELASSLEINEDELEQFLTDPSPPSGELAQKLEELLR
jgi:plasmid maintenance system antidote protein VapI